MLPLLPGYGFSAEPTSAGWDPGRVAAGLGGADAPQVGERPSWSGSETWAHFRPCRGQDDARQVRPPNRGIGIPNQYSVQPGNAEEVTDGPPRALEEFRAHLTGTSSPRGPKDIWLGEVVLHAEDIRRPLGIAHQHDAEALRRVANFYKGSHAATDAKEPIQGLRLRATDIDWSTGDGPEVSSPALSLAMARANSPGLMG